MENTGVVFLEDKKPWACPELKTLDVNEVTESAGGLGGDGNGSAVS